MITSVTIILGLAAVQLDPLAHQFTISPGLDNPTRLAVAGAAGLVTEPRLGAVLRTASTPDSGRTLPWH